MVAASNAGRIAHCIEIDSRHYENGKKMLDKYGIQYKEKI
jgi:hypothetical protein